VRKERSRVKKEEEEKKTKTHFLSVQEPLGNVVLERVGNDVFNGFDFVFSEFT
jgi:hypothetical protein